MNTKIMPSVYRFMLMVVVIGMMIPNAIARPVQYLEEGSITSETRISKQIHNFEYQEYRFSSVEVIDLDQEDAENSYRGSRYLVKKRRWYGYKILLAELGHFILPGFTYLISGPIVHFLEGEVLKGFKSFGVRVLSPPILAFATAYSICTTCDHDEGALLASILGGGMLGVLAAVVIDTSVFAYKDLSVTGTPLAMTPNPHGLRSIESRVLPQPWVLKWMVRF